MEKSRYKIVVLDGYRENPGDLDWAPLEALGDLTVYDRTSYEESDLIAERIGDADIAIVNKTPVSRRTMEKCPKLKAISVLATGYNIVDVESAKEKGITVMNIPVYGTRVVSQYAVGLLLEVCSHYGKHADAVSEGRWNTDPDWCFWDYPLIELYEKTAGIIGLGRIGRCTAGILGALGMDVIAYDSSECDEGRAVARYVGLDTLLAQSDVIFLHCPLFPDTEGIINEANISKMKDGVILINNSRGGLVVEEDLAAALDSGKVYAAAVDVVSTEPISEDNPLLEAKNCIITPHISWAAKEARQRIMDVTADNLKSWMAGEPINTVNR